MASTTLTVPVVEPARTTIKFTAPLASATVVLVTIKLSVLSLSTMLTVAFVIAPSSTSPTGVPSSTVKFSGPSVSWSLRMLTLMTWLVTPGPNVSTPLFVT